MEPLYDIPVQVTAVLGKTTLSVSQLLKMGPGSILELDKQVGDSVDIYVNNAFVKSLNLPVQTIVYEEVLVASDFIAREQTLTKDCTEVKKVDVSMRMNYILTEKMLEKEITTKKAFQKGEIIDKRFVKMRPDVARNSDVRIFFVSNGAVMISIDGTAMMDGMTGDYVNVENKNYKKVYNGKVIGENKVLVNI